MAASKSPGRSSGNDNLVLDSTVIREHDPEGEPRSIVYHSSETHVLSSITPPVSRDDTIYKMRGGKRKAIIFNHEKFSNTELDDRKGTVADVSILKERLKKLKFEVEVHNDLTFADMLQVLQKASRDDHKEEDCFLVAVLTHGDNVSGKDKLHAHDQDYDFEILWSYFKADSCKTLAGKPKIFFIQACRGKRLSKQVKFKSNVQKDVAEITHIEMTCEYSIPVEADILIAFSTFEGTSALRDTETGAWFIQELCKELEDNGEKLDLLSMLTNVNRRVALDYQFKQMPVIQSTLTRKIFLNTASEEEHKFSLDIIHTLEVTNERLDKITEFLESKESSSLSAPRLKTNKQKNSKWNSLQTPLQPIDIAMPSSEDIFKHGELLKMFIEDDPVHIESSLKEQGTLILNLLSCWDSLTDHMREYAYKNLVIFFNENARNWKMFKFFNVPVCSVRSQHCHRTMSLTDVTDGATSRIRSVRHSNNPRSHR